LAESAARVPEEHQCLLALEVLLESHLLAEEVL
jgi:hypothetical protein